MLLTSSQIFFFTHEKVHIKRFKDDLHDHVNDIYHEKWAAKNDENFPGILDLEDDDVYIEVMSPLSNSTITTREDKQQQSSLSVYCLSFLAHIVRLIQLESDPSSIITTPSSIRTRQCFRQ